MFTRIRNALGVTLVLIFLGVVPAFAKGGFDFITITGPGLKEALHVTDPSLTEDFFTFSNFYESRIKAPADPGKGYEITRHYRQGVSDVVFDRLQYYPETGFVFYDGIENGDSEYDDEWYTANPAIRTVFESALAVETGAAAPPDKKAPINAASELQPVEPRTQTKPVGLSSRSLTIMVFVLTAGLAAVFAFWRRKSSMQ